jgi:hypothetical protein
MMRPAKANHLEAARERMSLAALRDRGQLVKIGISVRLLPQKA